MRIIGGTVIHEALAIFYYKSKVRNLQSRALIFWFAAVAKKRRAENSGYM